MSEILLEKKDSCLISPANIVAESKEEISHHYHTKNLHAAKYWGLKYSVKCQNIVLNDHQIYH